MHASDHLLGLVRERPLDAAMGRIQVEHEQDHTFTSLGNETSAVMAGMRHPLFKKAKLASSSLMACPWILTPAGGAVREVFDQVLRKCYQLNN